MDVAGEEVISSDSEVAQSELGDVSSEDISLRVLDSV